MALSGTQLSILQFTAAGRAVCIRTLPYMAAKGKSRESSFPALVEPTYQMPSTDAVLRPAVKMDPLTPSLFFNFFCNFSAVTPLVIAAKMGLLSLLLEFIPRHI
jgi:hypothetical protein